MEKIYIPVFFVKYKFKTYNFVIPEIFKEKINNFLNQIISILKYTELKIEHVLKKQHWIYNCIIMIIFQKNVKN